MKLIVKTVGAFLLMLVAGVILGGSWGVFDVSWLGEMPEHVIRSLVHAAVYMAILWWAFRSNRLSDKQAIVIGVSLAGMRVLVGAACVAAFTGRPLTRILLNWVREGGSLLSLGMLAHLAGPWVVARVTRRRCSARRGGLQEESRGN